MLVAIHTSPSKAPQEIDELASVYDDVIRKLGVRDVIILGDFNAACRYMSDSDWRKNRLANDKRFHWLISDCVDTSLAGLHCAYDRWVYVVFNRWLAFSRFSDSTSALPRVRLGENDLLFLW